MEDKKERIIIVPDLKPDDIHKHGYVPTSIPIVDIKPIQEKPSNNDNSSSDKK